MAATDYSSVWGVVGNKSPSGMVQALETRGIYVVKDSESPTTLTPGNVQYLAFGGRLFRYDSTDATTANDGVTCCVTADGKRFKADNYAGSQKRIWEVKSMTLTAPPGSPAIGDQYVVAAGGSGLWAGKDKQVAAWAARGWQYIPPNTYDMVLNDADTFCYYYSIGGVWTSGFPGITIADNSISPRSLKYFKFGLKVVNQTTNTPPGSPADGDAYIIGSSPTGAWAAKARQVAIWEVSAWVYYAPYNGAQVFDANLGANVVYKTSSSTWTQNTGYAAIDASGSKSGTVSSISSGYTWSAGTAPTTSNTTVLQTENYTAKKSGAKLKITVTVDQIPFNSGSGTNVSFASAFGLFIDSTVNATDWCSGPGGGQSNTSSANITITANHAFTYTFFATAPDTSSHSYSLAASKSGGGSMTGARIIIEELA